MAELCDVLTPWIAVIAELCDVLTPWISVIAALCDVLTPWIVVIWPCIVEIWPVWVPNNVFCEVSLVSNAVILFMCITSVACNVVIAVALVPIWVFNVSVNAELCVSQVVPSLPYINKFDFLPVVASVFPK